MSSKKRTPSVPVPWYQKRPVVRAAGTIVGLLAFGWFSLFVVFHSARMSTSNPQSTGPSVDIDAHTFLSSFHPAFQATSPVESYYWPHNVPIIERTEGLAFPIVISSHAVSDWETLHAWVSGVDWIHNDAEYDFRVQNNSLFWSVDPKQPVEATFPLSSIESGRTEYLTMKRFLELELEEDSASPKYRKFDGFVFRASDQVRLQHCLFVPFC